MLEIVFRFSQVFGLILMLLKNLSYLFKAFGQSSEIDFFFLSSTPFIIFIFIYLFFCFVLFCFVLYYLYIKRENALKLQYFLFCSTCTVSLACLFIYLGMRKATIVLLHYFFFFLFNLQCFTK